VWPWQKKNRDAWVCRVCGQSHEDSPTDFGWLLPDEIWELGPEVQQEKLDWATDVCFHGDRWFLRGVLEIPFTFRADRWGWGVWVEVEQAVVGKLWALGDRDGSNEPRETGVLATRIPVYPNSVGQPVEVQFGPAEKRPLLHLPPECEHEIAIEQRNGMDEDAYHRTLAAVT